MTELHRMLLLASLVVWAGCDDGGSTAPGPDASTPDVSVGDADLADATPDATPDTGLSPDASPCPGGADPEPEICDGQDNDCNGEVDDIEQAGAACTSGLGLCERAGVIACIDGQPGCTAEPPPPPGEDDATCDGADEDCDGLTDEDVGSVGVTCGEGVCQRSTIVRCIDGDIQEDCQPGLPTGPDTDCDELDDDCDGRVDEGCRLAPPIALSLSGQSTCAFLSSARVACWGRGPDGEDIGDEPEEMGEALTGVRMPEFLVSLKAGEAHHCAHFETGTVRCWGANERGQLGYGDTQARGDGPGPGAAPPPIIDLGPGRAALQLAVGGRHNCALLDDATVKCWGDNTRGQLGYGDTRARGDQPLEMGANLPAVPMPPGRTPIEVAVGGRHTCVLLDDGAVQCWGANDHGQLGQGDQEHRGDGPGELGAALPMVLPADAGTVELALGAAHTCARSAQGVLRCWGAGALGQLGVGEAADVGGAPGHVLPQVPAGEDNSWVSITAAGSTTCGVLATGGLKCWGGNVEGAAGLGRAGAIGDEPEERVANLPEVATGFEAALELVLPGPTHTCALADGGHLKCWGANAQGQLGYGDRQPRGLTPESMGEGLPEVDLPGLVAQP